MADAVRGDWVRIYDILIAPGDRAEMIPEDTQKVPLEMWVKGSLDTELANIGERVTVTTETGRSVTGKLVDVTPSWNHGFGKYVPELRTLSSKINKLRSLL